MHYCEQKIFSSKKDLFIADSGYSGTPLMKKLGIKPEMKMLVIHKPEAYFEWLGADISQQFAVAKKIPNLIHLFEASTAVFKKEMVAGLKFCMKNTLMVVWVSWYKKSSGMVADHRKI